MNPPTIIGISGIAGSGKSLAAEVLSQDFDFVVVSFADSLKRTAMALWPLWDEETLWGPSELRNRPWSEYGGLTPRRALQYLGTEVGRALDEDVWVRQVELTSRTLLLGGFAYNRASGLYAKHGAKGVAGIVVPDTRFANELAFIARMGGKTWRIDRPGAGLVGEAGQHKSETSLDRAAFDGVLVNDGTLEQFREDVRAFARIAGLKQVAR